MKKKQVITCPDCGSKRIELRHGIGVRKGKAVPDYFECEDYRCKFELEDSGSGLRLILEE